MLSHIIYAVCQSTCTCIFPCGTFIKYPVYCANYLIICFKCVCVLYIHLSRYSYLGIIFNTCYIHIVNLLIQLSALKTAIHIIGIMLWWTLCYVINIILVRSTRSPNSIYCPHHCLMNVLNYHHYVTVHFLLCMLLV